tara:strand:+ start:1624 stop:1923 length:300 start_codon:yes stop_codon:yes gene_type:complete
MSQYRESTTGSLSSLISGAVIGAAGLAWWLFSEAERRQQTRKQRAMLYAPRIQDGSEALETSSPAIPTKNSEQLEQRVEQLNAAIADVRKQLEDLGGNN